jgi:hypothetical protein
LSGEFFSLWVETAHLPIYQRKGVPLPNQLIKTNRQQGRFVKGQSGNPNGRPKGSTGHNAELRKLEDDALTLACHTADVIAETACLALVEIEHPELLPLFDAITGVIKDAVKEGKIGPSSVAMLRTAYDDLEESFFVHAGLPSDCDWPTFEKHYRTRGRIDFDRFVGDYATFPPIAERIEELRAERLLSPVNDEPLNKLKNGFD